MADLEQQYDVLIKTQETGSEKIKSLSADIGDLSKNVDKQEQALKSSKDTFDLHKKSVEAVKSAFEKLKDSNKDFGDVMDKVTKGFNIMKDGLDLVKTGFTSVGGAIKATAFGFLVTVLQSLVEYFTKTTEGAKKLRGGIAAINLVIKTVKDYVSNVFGVISKSITDAFNHPAETVKKVWNAVIENLTNRFKGIKVFLEGVFSGNLKEAGNGLIQMGTGVTNGIDKITAAAKEAKQGLESFSKQVVKTYEEAANAKPKGSNGEGSKSGQPQQKEDKTRGKTLEQAKSTGIGSSREANEEDAPQSNYSNSEKPASQNLSESSTSLQTEIDDAHKQGKWKLEFEKRQEQLDKQHEQAVDAARKAGESTLKVDQDFKEKQKELDKAKLDAQLANQKSYLKSVDSLSSALTGIFGKNTVAAKVAFKAHQAAAAGQVIIDTEKSIMGIWSADASIPFVGVAKAIAETAVVGAAGAASLASIIKQKPGFAKGGYYASDGRGALLSGYSRTDDTNAYLRSGEAIVVSEAMRNPWARNLVSAINVAHGGRDFSVANPGRGYAIGGIFTDGGNANRYYSQPANDVKDLANTLAYQMINNFPPIYVDVKDVNSQQNILAQTINRVNL